MLSELSIAILGFPNAGKSTFLNAVMDTELSSMSSTAGTTRHRVVGLTRMGDRSLQWIDTPGLYFRPPRSNHLVRTMHREAVQAAYDSHLKLFIVDSSLSFGAIEDQLKLLSEISDLAPDFVVLNQIDRLKEKKTLLTRMKLIHTYFSKATLIPISALKKDGIDRVLKSLELQLQNIKGDPLSPEEERESEELFTLTPMRQIAIDHIRGAFLEGLYQEVPLQIDARICLFEERKKDVKIHAEIWVAKESQKAILIGRQGIRVKKSGTLARQKLEAIFGKTVHLMVHVKARPQWNENETSIQELRT